MITQALKDLRITGIGGSDAAAVVGLSKYKTNVDVFLEKIGLKDQQDNFNNEAIYWGNVLESIVADEYSKRTNKNLIIKNETIRDKDNDFMIANVDRLIDDGGVLECKTASAFRYKDFGDEGSDNMPDEYLIQCAHYAIVTDAKYVDLAVLIGGQNFKIYKYERDKKLEQKIINAERDFWLNNVLKKQPPEIKSYEDASKFYNNPVDCKKRASEEIYDNLKTLKQIKLEIKNLEKKEDELKASICSYLGNDTVLIDDLDREVLTWKSKAFTRFDATSFKKDHADLYEKYTKKTEIRELRLK